MHVSWRTATNRWAPTRDILPTGIYDQSAPLSRGGPIGLTRSGGAPLLPSTYSQRPADRAYRRTRAAVLSLTP
ncbi:MAG: hypothetical protein ACLQGP_19225, partial [Isosphaeraceae bacterium]